MRPARIISIVAGILIPACSAWANYVEFSEATDTISVAGNTVLPTQNQVTYEAIIEPTSIDYASSTSADQSGVIYEATEYGAEDEHFYIGSTDDLGAYAFPVNYPHELIGGTVPLNSWVDVAYVYNGSEESLYLDGNLLASRPAAITLGPPYPQNGDLSYSNDGGTVTIGAIYRDGGVVPPFIGNILSLRISDVARYSGDSYTPSMSDFTDDSSTILLYDFDHLPPGSTTIQDLSGNGHTGAFGVGFVGATSPSIVDVPEPSSTVALLVLLPFIGLRRV
jgi:Concanavalin A-like lectin/glucanases superfamily